METTEPSHMIQVPSTRPDAGQATPGAARRPAPRQLPQAGSGRAAKPSAWASDRSAAGGNRHADAAAGVGAETFLLLGEVERADLGAAGAQLRGDPLGRDQPAHLELDAVGVASVERLGGGMVARADERAELAELGGDALELGEGVDLPGQVVQADAGAMGRHRPCLRAELEQAQVVVVARAGRLQEGGAAQVLHPLDGTEAECVAVEGDAGGDVADVQDGVVEALHGHGDPRPVVANARAPRGYSEGVDKT